MCSLSARTEGREVPVCGQYGSLRRMRADLGGDQRACALSRCEAVRAGGGGAGPLQHRYSGPTGAGPPGTAHPGAERQRCRHASAVGGEPFLGEASLQAASLGSNPEALGPRPGPHSPSLCRTRVGCVESRPRLGPPSQAAQGRGLLSQTMQTLMGAANPGDQGPT